MTRALVALVGLLLVVASCASGASSPAVRVSYAGGQCGAVKVGPQLFLTAGHCVDWEVDAEVAIVPLNIWQTTARGRILGRSVRASRADDLAWLELPETTDTTPIVRLRAGREGERVYAISPVYSWVRRDGTLLRPAYQGARSSIFWETDLTIAPGWSGSPVIATVDGALVGVVSSCQGGVRWVGETVEKYCLPRFAIVAGAHE